MKPTRELDTSKDVNFLSFIALGVSLQVMNQCRTRLKQLKKKGAAEEIPHVANAARELKIQARQAVLLLESLREIAPIKDPQNDEVAKELIGTTNLLAEVLRTEAIRERGMDFVLEVTVAVGEINALVEHHLSLAEPEK